jgi:hypothetical protein
MALPVNVSIPVAAGVAGLVYSIHANATPNMTDIRTSVPGSVPHENVAKARRQATWMSIGIVAAVSLLAKDPTIFVVGGAMTVAMDWWTRYSNEINPSRGIIEQPETPPVVGAEGRSGQVVQMSPYGGQAAVM